MITTFRQTLFVLFGQTLSLLLGFFLAIIDELLHFNLLLVGLVLNMVEVSINEVICVSQTLELQSALDAGLQTVFSAPGSL